MFNKDLSVKTRKLSIIQLGEPIPQNIYKEAEKARNQVEGLDVKYFAGSGMFDYNVPSPLVKYESNNISTRAYGQNGVYLIQDVVAGLFD